MTTWTITMQTGLNRETLYAELLALKKKLKISAFFIHGGDMPEQEARAQ